MGEVWSRIERLLPGVERPARYIDGEWNSLRAGAVDYRVALVYPDTYEIGQPNQAIGILYERLNALGGVAAERAYLPWVDMTAAMRAAGVPLPTLESAIPLRECDLIGVTLPYELTYTNVLEVLDLGGVPVRSADRGERDPLVVGGGPCAYNPEPLAPFLDAVLLGDGERAAAEIVEAHRGCIARGATRADTLEALSRVPGVYVPSLYEASAAGPPRPIGDAPPVVVKRVVDDLDAEPGPCCPVVPYMDVVHDRVTVEVLRGCTRGCRFCQAGMVYRPVRERSPDAVVAAAVEGLRRTGYEEVSLTSLSTTDHSLIADIVRRLVRRLEGTATSVSLPSLRADAFGIDMASLVSRGKRSGLTLAPEAGTQRLRDVVNKNVTEEDLLDSVSRAFAVGWRRVKLYFMIGLPTETDEDVAGIGALVGRVLAAARAAAPERERGGVRVAVSVSTFVPKAHTPFQWEPQIAREEVERRQALLRGSVPRKGVELSWHDADVSFLEGVLARGGREIAPAVEAAWRSGAVFDSWSERFSLGRWLAAFEEAGVDAASVACRERTREEPLPWEHLSAALDRGFLWGERERAVAAGTTADCSFSGCTACGVCDTLGVEVRTAGVRRG